MFSRPLILSAVVATTLAGKSFLPYQSLTETSNPNSYQAGDGTAYGLVTGTAYMDSAPCQQCIIGGYEYVMTLAADYVQGGLASAKAGYCCVPGFYTTNDSCGSVTALTSAMKSSRSWATRELALANCPNVSAMCGGLTQLYDLDADAGIAKVATVGAAGVTMTKNDSCSYIVKSKCKAPTVDFGYPTTSDTADKEEIYDISYVEYSENTFTALTTAQNIISVDAVSSEEKINMLGGQLFPVLWKDANNVVTSVSSALFATWISAKAAEYKAYTDLVESAAYKESVDQYNYFAAGKAWAKAWALANADQTISETVTEQYTASLRPITNAANIDLTVAPEKPMVPILPLAYAGPAFQKIPPATQPASSFMLQAGMGRPTLGKLGFVSAGGFGHAFGVIGQGNESTKAATDSDTDTAKNFLWPAQPADLTMCKDSWLIVNVKGTVKQVTAGSTLALTFMAKDFQKIPFDLDSLPTATLVVPMARESANFLAAGVATVAMVAASLY